MVVQRKYPDELRERTVKMVLEVREREGKGHGELARIASMPWNLRPAASGLSPSVGPCRPGPVPGTLDPPICSGVGSMPITTLAVQIWAFCAP